MSIFFGVNEVIEVNDDTMSLQCDCFHTGITYVVNFERSDNFSNFDNFLNCHLSTVSRNPTLH